MQATQDQFPVFEANQVLTSGHLNDLFNYLDEQDRLARANLIGVGIVCGLEVQSSVAGNQATVHLSKGCGITSQGYLAVEPVDVALVSCRNYVPPDELAYPLFDQLPLWELLPAGEDPDAAALSADFLAAKAVLLFVELKKQNLRNCSPNNCDDKGARITATTRRLLIERDRLDALIQAASGAVPQVATVLPELRLPRFDVPQTHLASAKDILAAFLKVFQAKQLASKLGQALSAAYAAFKPLLQDAYPTDPFAGFGAKFGFLDSQPTDTEQACFLQYYYDCFDELLTAYAEFRRQAEDLACGCCPPAGLFPRHLALGPAQSAAAGAALRQGFLPSPAVGACEAQAKEVLLLFRRLVGMVEGFTHRPELPVVNGMPPVDPQIRITPSLLGGQPLGRKAIPYYYRQDGSPPLYQVWDADKTRRGVAHHNLAYQCERYAQPVPEFVRQPLDYDWSACDFLRVEGHLGKDYQRVLNTLLSLKERHRLPIDVVALRGGVYGDGSDVGFESCQFEDLEAIYDALREELLASLAEAVRALYDIRIIEVGTLPGGVPKLGLLKAYAPNYQYPSNSLGGWYEENLSKIQTKAYIEIDQANDKDYREISSVFSRFMEGLSPVPGNLYQVHGFPIYYLMKVAETLPATLKNLNYSDFANKYQDLLKIARYCNTETGDRIGYVSEKLKATTKGLLSSRKLDAIKSVHGERLRRVEDLGRWQSLPRFLQDHPGIQHKAGVPPGGTFVLVYHQQEGTAKPMLGKVAGLDAAPDGGPDQAGAPTLAGALARIGGDESLVSNPDIQLLLGSFASFQGQVATSADVIDLAVNGLADGAVIADFYLPYLCRSDRPPVQFVLPSPRPRFDLAVGCTDTSGLARVAVTAKGGQPPYSISIDGEGYRILGSETLSLAVGSHTLLVCDAEGQESIPRNLTIAAPLVLGEASFHDGLDRTYTVTLPIEGGSPPYSVRTAIEGGAESEIRLSPPADGDMASYVTGPVPSNKTVSITVADSKECSVSKAFRHSLPLPCEGMARRMGYYFWLPDPSPDNPYLGVKIYKAVFSFANAISKMQETVDLSAEFQAIIGTVDAADLNDANRFTALVDIWLDDINKLVAKKTGDSDWLKFSYQPSLVGLWGELWIEYFECLPFMIRIDLGVEYQNGEYSIVIEYMPDGTTMMSQGGIMIPAFDAVRIDKYRQTSESICANMPSLSLSVDAEFREENGRFLATLKLIKSGTEDAKLEYGNCLWELRQAGTPMLLGGEMVEVEFIPVGTSTALVGGGPIQSDPIPVEPVLEILWFRVTVFNPYGCRVSRTDTLAWSLASSDSPKEYPTEI